MNNPITTEDLELLRERGFTPGWSGESWFGIDKEGNEWQVYGLQGDSLLTFVKDSDRQSFFMERITFEELFPEQGAAQSRQR